jgi:hypothetical protein
MQGMQVHVARNIWRTIACFVAVGICLDASAQTALVDEVHTVATAQTGVPVEQDFQVSAAGTYVITLTDLGAQATTSPLPLASLKMALTADDALVGTPIIVEGTGAPTPATGIGTITFTTPASATYPLSYRIHVIGAPATGYASGPISIQVASQGAGTALETWNDAISLPTQALPSTEALLEETYTVSTAGAYTVALADLALPQTLGTVTMILIETGTSTAYVLPNASQQTLTLAAGTYQIYALGQVSSSATGGLFGVTITAPNGVSGSTGWAEPVGTTVALGNAVLSAGSYTFSANDLKFPAALAQLGAVVVNSGAPVPLTVGGASATTLGTGQIGSFAVTGGGTYQVYVAAAPASAAPGAGSYSAQIASQGGAVVFSGAQTALASTSTVVAFPLNATVATAGSYTATLTDFATPSALTVADFAVVQNGALVGTPLNVPGGINVNLTAAPVTLLAILQGGSGGSVVDLNLTSTSGSILIDQTEGAGVVMAATQVSITTPGTYQITLSDLQWPAPFGTLAGIVTQGGTLVGQIYGGGTLNAIKATAGNYFVNVLATPSSGTTNPDDAGTYVLNVSQAPPAPTVSLTADAASVTSGGTVNLIWTTTNATSCVASGGGWTGTFTGAQAASDSATSPAITSATTFTLTCTGTGGTQTGSVSVSIVTSSASHGGGGALNTWTLLFLALVVTGRLMPNAMAKPRRDADG